MERPTKKQLVKGMLVDITKEEEVYRGYIKEINGTNTKRGVLVTLTDGTKGRVLKIVKKDEFKRENFIFYNKLVNKRPLFSIYDNDSNLFYKVKYKNGHLFSFLYDNKEQADVRLNKIKQHIPNRNLSVRTIPHKKKINEVFKKAQSTALLINDERSISIKMMEKFEKRVL